MVRALTLSALLLALVGGLMAAGYGVALARRGLAEGDSDQQPESVRLQVLYLALLGTVFLAGGCGEEAGSTGGRATGVAPEDPGPIHVHGLGVNPSDRALFIATHTGLFRLARDERKAKRVAGRYQDTMAFKVVGPDRFLGSGHPDAREGLPPFLGLIESRDAGESWKPISLLGKADFHLLVSAGRHVYGFGSDWETREEQLLLSRDGGRNWNRLRAPESLVGLAAKPNEPRLVIAAGQRGLWHSDDGGRRWTRLGGPTGLLGWPRATALFRVDPAGRVHRSRDEGRRWQAVGENGGEPGAFLAQTADELFVALHDGTIKHSTDGGASWSVRSTP